jgi:hypothetical protein
MMSRRLVSGGVLGLGAVALVWWLIREPSVPTLEPVAEGRTHFEDPAPIEGMESDEEPERRPAPRPSDSEARRQVAEALREAIREAREARTGDVEPAGEGEGTTPSRVTAGGGVGGEADDEHTGTMDPEYIRDAVQEIRPLLAECYELAKDAAEREGLEAPEGRLVTRFVFTGEPDVGGVVEESEVLEESSLRDPTLEECFRETLYTLELPAPDEGGTITVHYPFELSNEPEEE